MTTPRGCFGKLTYQTQPEAKTALAKVRERRGEARDLSVYHCEHCGGFHLGRRFSGRQHRAFIDKRAKVKRYYQLVRGETV